MSDFRIYFVVIKISIEAEDYWRRRAFRRRVIGRIGIYRRSIEPEWVFTEEELEQNGYLQKRY